jgi:hypothetical protein
MIYSLIPTSLINQEEYSKFEYSIGNQSPINQ